MRSYLSFIYLVVLYLVCNGNVINRRKTNLKPVVTSRSTGSWRNPLRLVSQKKLYPNRTTRGGMTRTSKKAVVVDVNGEKVYGGANSEPNPANCKGCGRQNINLHINLHKKNPEGGQPQIITVPIPGGGGQQSFPQRPSSPQIVVVPAPAPAPAPLPQPPPVLAPAPQPPPVSPPVPQPPPVSPPVPQPLPVVSPVPQPLPVLQPVPQPAATVPVPIPVPYPSPFPSSLTASSPALSSPSQVQAALLAARLGLQPSVAGAPPLLGAGSLPVAGSPLLGSSAGTMSSPAFSPLTGFLGGSNPPTGGPEMGSSPGLTVPGISPPGLTGPGINSPGMTSPGMSSPGMTGPGMSSPGMTGPGMSTPALAGQAGGTPGQAVSGCSCGSSCPCSNCPCQSCPCSNCPCQSCPCSSCSCQSCPCSSCSCQSCPCAGTSCVRSCSTSPNTCCCSCQSKQQDCDDDLFDSITKTLSIPVELCKKASPQPNGITAGPTTVTSSGPSSVPAPAPAPAPAPVPAPSSVFPFPAPSSPKLPNPAAASPPLVSPSSPGPPIAPGSPLSSPVLPNPSAASPPIQSPALAGPPSAGPTEFSSTSEPYPLPPPILPKLIPQQSENGDSESSNNNGSEKPLQNTNTHLDKAKQRDVEDTEEEQGNLKTKKVKEPPFRVSPPSVVIIREENSKNNNHNNVKKIDKSIKKLSKQFEDAFTEAVENEERKDNMKEDDDEEESDEEGFSEEDGTSQRPHHRHRHYQGKDKIRHIIPGPLRHHEKENPNISSGTKNIQHHGSGQRYKDVLYLHHRIGKKIEINRKQLKNKQKITFNKQNYFHKQENIKKSRAMLKKQTKNKRKNKNRKINHRLSKLDQHHLLSYNKHDSFLSKRKRKNSNKIFISLVDGNKVRFHDNRKASFSASGEESGDESGSGEIKFYDQTFDGNINRSFLFDNILFDSTKE